MTHLATTAADTPPPGLSRRRRLFANARLAVVVSAFLVGAGAVVWSQVDLYLAHTRPFRVDPAPFFYLTAAIGLACRAFWARYLTISFAAALTSLNVVFGPMPLASAAGGLAFVALLSGPTMRDLFDARPSPKNGWAVATDARVTRLRALFVCQAVAIAFLWYHDGVPAAVTAAACIALAGLAFHRTWAVLMLVPVLVFEACVGLGLGVGPGPASWPNALTPWAYGATLVVAASVSFALVAPLLWAFGKKMREPLP